MARLLLCVGLVATLAIGAAVLPSILLLLLLLLILLLGLRLCSHNPIVVLRVLEIVFCHHTVAGGIGVARKLEIFFIHVCRRAADFNLGSGRIEGTVRIVPAAAIVMTAACVLRPTAASA